MRTAPSATEMQARAANALQRVATPLAALPCTPAQASTAPQPLRSSSRIKGALRYAPEEYADLRETPGDDSYLDPETPTPLQAVTSLLPLAARHHIPAGGFTPQAVASRRGEQAMGAVLRAFQGWIAPGLTPATQCQAAPNMATDPYRLQGAKLVLAGPKGKRLHSLAHLCSCMPRREVAELLEEARAGLDASTPEFRLTAHRYYAAKQLGERLLDDGSMDKAPCRTKLDPEVVEAAVHYLRETLPPLPATCRTIAYGGLSLDGVEVLSRGSATVAQLWESYRASAPSGTLGLPTFSDLVELLCRPGEVYSCLPTFLVEFQHLQRSVELAVSDETCVQQWRAATAFFSGPYCFRHVSECDGVLTHCLQHALGAECGAEHDKVCLECDRHFRVAEALFPRQPALSEMVTTLLRRYVEHQVRARHQRREILALRAALVHGPGNFTTGILTLDHKQKVLPMKQAEGQADFYGKKGMSVLGAMLHYAEVRDGVLGTARRYIDVVADGYSDQDACQVQHLLRVILDVCAKLLPGLETVHVVSDGAPAFKASSHLAFVQALNAKSKIRITRWTYTEAQAGKSELDTHFAFFQKGLSNACRAPGASVVSPAGIYRALAESSGISGTTFVLADMTCMAPRPASGRPVPGIKGVHDITFTPTGVETRSFSGLQVGFRVLGNSSLQVQELPDVQVAYKSCTHPAKPHYWVPTTTAPAFKSTGKKPQVTRCRGAGKGRALVVLGAIEATARVPPPAPTEVLDMVRPLSPGEEPYTLPFYWAEKKDWPYALAPHVVDVLAGWMERGMDRLTAEEAHERVAAHLLALEDWEQLFICVQTRVKLAMQRIDRRKLKGPARDVGCARATLPALGAPTQVDSSGTEEDAIMFGKGVDDALAVIGAEGELEALLG
jgi:hypothetical protein